MKYYEAQPILIRSLMLPTLLFCLLFFVSTEGFASSEQSDKPLKVGFIIPSPATDCNWGQQHDQGRRYMEAKLAGKVETMLAESVAEGGEVERVMEKMISQGCKLIFSASFGYLESVLRVAERHPDVKFMQAHRYANRENVGEYFYSTYEGMYAAGVAAGRITKTNKVGVIANRPVYDTFQDINAFTLGAQSVQPKVKVKVVWMNSWYDPPLEAEAARSLFETGIDVLVHDPGSATTIAQIAEKNKIYIVSSYSDNHQFAPQYWLTAPVLDWGPFYTREVQSVLNGTWKSGLRICNAKEGTVKLAPFGKMVPVTVQNEATNTMNKIKQDKLTIFKGPLEDSFGKIRLAAGEKPDIYWLGKMNFFVPGVEGAIPVKH